MTWGIFKKDSISDAYLKLKEGLNKSDVPAYKRKDDKLTLDDLEKERTKNLSHPETLAKNNGTQKESVEQLAEMEFDKNGRYVHKAKPGVYGGSEKESDYVKGPSDAALKKIEAEKKKKVKKEDFELFNEKELDMIINEVLSANTSAGKWISDFVHSDNPKFAGKSTEQRKQMALGAYYAAQRKESTDYESFLVLDEAVQGDIVKMDAKEIKHANMKDKQDEAEVMEPHSEGEADFLDKHAVLVTDEPAKAAGNDQSGKDKLKAATGPKGKGPGSYDAKEKLGKQGAVKEAVFKTPAGEEIDTEPTEKKDKDKKSFRSVRNPKAAVADSTTNF